MTEPSGREWWDKWNQFTVKQKEEFLVAQSLCDTQGWEKEHREFIRRLLATDLFHHLEQADAEMRAAGFDVCFDEVRLCFSSLRCQLTVGPFWCLTHPAITPEEGEEDEDDEEDEED